MTSFYICRHGQTENNKLRKHQGWIDTPLTDEGIAQAKVTAQKLSGINFNLIVSSDLGRAFTTAYIISREIGYKEEIIRRKDLREVNYGDLANTPYESFPHINPEDLEHYIPHNGESVAQMQARVLKKIEALSINYPNKTILIVAHDGTINAVRASFTRQAMAIANSVTNPHDYIARFEMDHEKINSFADFKS